MAEWHRRGGSMDKKTIITTTRSCNCRHDAATGNYVIKLAESSSNRHIVQFFDKDEKHLITTFCYPNQRLRLTGKSVFAFWKSRWST